MVALEKVTSNLDGLNTWAPAGIFVGGSEPQKAPLKTKKAPPQKKCASTVLRGIGGMLSRENVNSCAPYYILDASQQERI